MTQKFRVVFEKLIKSPRKVFLVDCTGAILTVFFLLVILARFDGVFGMPKRILYYLASIASIFAFFSLMCFVANFKKWALFLKVIMTANLIYCCLTITAVIYFFNKLTILGILYFLLEVLIIIAVVITEQMTIIHYKQQKHPS